ncbi:hypothetical protein BC826DRAFT_1013194 [Russula brevipes]|nr:hypothetical protein BC826DRAFT_1013194 [Russula brevipes]
MTPSTVFGGKALGSGTTRNSLSCSGTDFRSTSRNAQTFSKESIDTLCTRSTLLPFSPRSQEVHRVEADVAASDRSELHAYAYIDTRSDRSECLTPTPSETLELCDLRGLCPHTSRPSGRTEVSAVTSFDGPVSPRMRPKWGPSFLDVPRSSGPSIGLACNYVHQGQQSKNCVYTCAWKESALKTA